MAKATPLSVYLVLAQDALNRGLPLLAHECLRRALALCPAGQTPPQKLVELTLQLGLPKLEGGK